MNSANICGQLQLNLGKLQVWYNVTKDWLRDLFKITRGQLDRQIDKLTYIQPLLLHWSIPGCTTVPINTLQDQYLLPCQSGCFSSEYGSHTLMWYWEKLKVIDCSKWHLHHSNVLFCIPLLILIYYTYVRRINFQGQNPTELIMMTIFIRKMLHRFYV